jgi:hypothetical protein
MIRQALLFGLAVVLTYGSLSQGAYAQQANNIPRIGVLINSPLTSPHYRAFLQGLQDLGYVEGKNISIVAKSAAPTHLLDRAHPSGHRPASPNVSVHALLRLESKFIGVCAFGGKARPGL